MKLFRLITLLTVAVALSSSACAKRTPVGRGTSVRPLETVPAPPPPPLEATAPVTSEPELTEEERFARKSLAELNAERPLPDVLFRLDDSAIDEEARATLQRGAEWLRRWPSTRVMIEGHCDERGTSEYNLALGERRANAVRTYLVSLGVDGARLTVVSKGEESPVCIDQNEDCWLRNRRAQSTITAK